MKLTHQEITIRNATADDAAQLAAWWNDGQVMAHAGFPNGIGTTAQKIAEELKKDHDQTKRRLIIEYNKIAIGEMCYYCLENHIAEIGIKICNTAYQEKGIGKIALSMLIRQLFHMGFVKIVLDTNLNNKRAQHVYEKLGFQKIRVRTNSWIDQLGQLQSAVDYELTECNFIEFS